jgi:hypothetical protein
MAYVTKSEQSRRLREFRKSGMAGNTAGLGCSGCRAESRGLQCPRRLGPLCKGCDSEKDAGLNAQRSCPFARDAVIPQVHECVAFDFIRTALSLAYYCDKRHCGGRHLTYVCARNCTTHAQRFAHRFAACCVRRTAFALRSGLA